MNDKVIVTLTKVHSITPLPFRRSIPQTSAAKS